MVQLPFPYVVERMTDYLLNHKTRQELIALTLSLLTPYQREKFNIEDESNETLANLIVDLMGQEELYEWYYTYLSNG